MGVDRMPCVRSSGVDGMRYVGDLMEVYRLYRYNDLFSSFRHMPSLSLPDGSHRLSSETTLVIYPTVSGIPLYGVSTMSAIDVKDMSYTADPSITRSVIQKSLVVVSEIPCWDLMIRLTREYCEELFERKDFRSAQMIMSLLYESVNKEILRSTNIMDTQTLPRYHLTLLQQSGLERSMDMIPNSLKEYTRKMLKSQTIMKPNLTSKSRDIIQEYILQNTPKTHVSLLWFQPYYGSNPNMVPTLIWFNPMTVQPPPTGHFDEYIMSSEVLITVMKALLLECRIIVWGPSASLVSSIVVYFTTIVPICHQHYSVNVFDLGTIVLPYASLDLLKELNEARSYIIGTTNVVYLSQVPSDLVVICPHDDITVTPETLGVHHHHLPSSKVTAIDVRNKQLKSVLQPAEFDSKLSKGLGIEASAPEPEENTIFDSVQVSPRRNSEDHHKHSNGICASKSPGVRGHV
ncbi:AVL9-like protein [Gregarina niphandrodes]|uniref:AVL9-like protein n=1 Tax=Gregarina niphandrodes TaxID=110365 RepID=A0A023B9R2_GRENI|nr:AVL9-like protein [Gregarina niphandrodes]EZG73005.1 AVL9-like protein [Gregarina niphandrodes]|eukprot:XP_011129700.1 AVL9-like protein [Gregarina niphandrodes]